MPKQETEFLKISHADVHFNQNGTPYAKQFEDLYFSDSLGIEETQHVFLQHNNLPTRWLNWPSSQFVIAETGFGTGLNFLVALAAFDKLLSQGTIPKFKLFFISIEKYPLKSADLVTALQHYPSLAEYSQQLIEHYPPNVAGCHRIEFLNGLVSLDLWFGDVHEVLPQWQAKLGGIVDTWFLDGFAPSKNPDMWTPALFKQMVRLAKIHATFATFTAVGEVKRGLESAGFTVTKKPGHGKKRHNLTGVLHHKKDLGLTPPYFARLTPPAPSQPRIAIIGGGLAAANCAYALKKRNLACTIYCEHAQLAQGASGNHIGALYPHLNSELNTASEFYSLAYLFAAKVYRQLATEASLKFAHQWCGVLQLAFNAKTQTRLQKFVSKQIWSEQLVHWVNCQQASQLANINLPYEGLFFPQGGWINPPQLVKSLIEQAKSSVKVNKQVKSMAFLGQHWQLDFNDGSNTQADIVISATGSNFANIAQISPLSLYGVRGQVEHIDSEANPQLSALATVLCHKGYLTPAYNGIHALGSTYIKNDYANDYRLAEKEINISLHKKALNRLSWIHDLSHQSSGRASTRSSTPDHLPMAGCVPKIDEQKQQYWDLFKALPEQHYPLPINHPNLYIVNGLGSRGLTTAPILADIIASQICDEPFPVSNAILNSLSPNRFLVRSLIRREI